LEARVRKGIDIEDVVKEINWQDFEGIVSEAFSVNGFRSFRNFRFSSNKKRYEVDVVAISKPRIILVDCKHWGLRLGKPSALRLAATAQVNREKEFCKKLQEFDSLHVEDWAEATVIPALITLYQERVTQSDGAMIVPVFKLNSFIEEMRNGFFDSTSVKIPHLAKW
jgi:hypothetical protein